MRMTMKKSLRAVVMARSSSRRLPLSWHLECRRVDCTPMQTEPEFRPTRYSKWNHDGSGRQATRPDIAREEPKATRTQSAVEIILFVVFGLLIVLAGVALYTSNSKKYKEVPNAVDAG